MWFVAFSARFSEKKTNGFVGNESSCSLFKLTWIRCPCIGLLMVVQGYHGDMVGSLGFCGNIWIQCILLYKEMTHKLSFLYPLVYFVFGAEIEGLTKTGYYCCTMHCERGNMWNLGLWVQSLRQPLLVIWDCNFWIPVKVREIPSGKLT